MNPEQLLRYLQDNMQRAMPDLLAHMLERTETRITMARDMASRGYIIYIDLMLEGRRMASYQQAFDEELLRSTAPRTATMQVRQEGQATYRGRPTVPADLWLATDRPTRPETPSEPVERGRRLDFGTDE